MTNSSRMIGHWQRALKQCWGIDAELSQLDGEYDLNFLVKGDKEYVLKVMRTGCDSELIEMQCQAFEHLRVNAPAVPVPSVIRSNQENLFESVQGEELEPRLVWLLEKCEGHVYAAFKPKSHNLIYQIGQAVASADMAWADFEHPGLHRKSKWNLLEGEWIAEKLGLIVDGKRRSLVNDAIASFQALKPELDTLENVAIHNDVNDYNVIVSGSLCAPAVVTGLIDLGDMCAAPRICDLAIAAAYLVMEQNQVGAPLAALVSGYHSVAPLSEMEISLIVPLLRMRLAVSVVNSTKMALEKPDDPYVVISQKSAWALLENEELSSPLIRPRLRLACGYPFSESSNAVSCWLDAERGNFASVLGISLSEVPMKSLSVEATSTPQNPLNLTAQEAHCLGQNSDNGDEIWMGYYKEPRLVYTDKGFSLGPWKTSNRRTVHLGVDCFAAAGTPVYSPLQASVYAVDILEGNLDYGGFVVLKHKTPDSNEFFTLYGHLEPASVASLNIGEEVAQGESFAVLGRTSVNGGWNPHLHFQLLQSCDGVEGNWPGVADPDDLTLWVQLCPNPAALLNLDDEYITYSPTSKIEVQGQRAQCFGDNLKLSYNSPLMLLRGWRHHLFDEWGRPYLDAYNNVPHVGHAHPRIHQVVSDQLKRVNTNTRYLHPAQTGFAKKILSKLPPELSVCFLVNSGSEANELALRLARAHTGGKDMITPDHGYHGNTTGAIDVSAYKFNAKGGVGPVNWVQLIDVADDYRGQFRRDDRQRAKKYADLALTAISNIQQRGGKLAGFIAETYPSVGGQIIPPDDYLATVYKHIRSAGGVCIADEVQTGLGRLGDFYFAFEQQQALPDVVVLGKPIGNGHPIGVVVTTKDIAETFAQGPEFFSTFGGSTLSCRVGKEVLDIVDDENLMLNAKRMGDKLISGLRILQDRYDMVGDVRGMGLFIGVDLVTDKASRTPATHVADYVKRRLCENRILVGCEGPADNILKIRPPLTIEESDIELILLRLDEIFSEVDVLTG